MTLDEVLSCLWGRTKPRHGAVGGKKELARGATWWTEDGVPSTLRRGLINKRGCEGGVHAGPYPEKA